MYPHERSLVKKLADKPFAIIGVNSDRDLDEIREVVKEKNITWRSFWNGPEGTGGPISKAWNVSGWPTIYVIDAEGKIRYKNARGPELDEAITELLAEMGEEVDLTDHADEDAGDEKPEAKADAKEEADADDKAAVKAEAASKEAADAKEDSNAKEKADSEEKTEAKPEAEKTESKEEGKEG